MRPDSEQVGPVQGCGLVAAPRLAGPGFGEAVGKQPVLTWGEPASSLSSPWDQSQPELLPLARLWWFLCWTWPM